MGTHGDEVAVCVEFGESDKVTSLRVCRERSKAVFQGESRGSTVIPAIGGNCSPDCHDRGAVNEDNLLSVTGTDPLSG